jgi:polysaccharide biosynthesis PFTS motif protein
MTKINFHFFLKYFSKKLRLNRFFAFNNFKTVRQELNGYSNLPNLFFFEKIRDDLTITKFKNINSKNSIFENSDELELVIRQFMLLNSMKQLTNSLLYYFGSRKVNKLSISLPKDWLDILKNNGIKIDYFNSKIKWYLKIFYHFIYNEFFLIKLIFVSFIKIFFYKTNNNFKLPYVYFTGLSKTNFSEYGVEKNGVTSFFNQFYFKNEFKKIFHDYKNNLYYENDVEIKHLNLFSQYPKKSYFRIISWSFINIFIQIKAILYFDWVDILLLTENSVAIRMKYQNKNLVAKKYLFHNSNWIYRPIWTYQAEKMGSSIEFYFYSVNILPLSTNKINGLPFYGYKSMNWPLYIVWDEYHLNYLKIITSTINNYIVFRPIIFTKQKKLHYLKKRKTIAVFDIQPVRESYYKLHGGTSMNYYSMQNCKNFISDIYLESIFLEFDIIYKRKRSIGKLLHFEYKKLISEFDKSHTFTSIDDTISLDDIFTISDAIICQPFTSVALHAKYHNKPVIYYESRDILKSENMNTHEIPFIKGVINLRNWLQSI